MTLQVSPEIQAVNVTGAALIVQLSLSLIVLVASALMSKSEGYVPFQGERRWGSLPWIAGGLLLLTLGTLMFTSEFSPVWAPLFGAGAVPLLSSETALLITFVADISCVWLLVHISGGAKNSPFTSLFFLIPPLALFLREPVGRVVFYTAFVSIAYSLCTTSSRKVRYDERGKEITVDIPRLPGWLVAVTGLVLATFIGIVTRP